MSWKCPCDGKCPAKGTGVYETTVQRTIMVGTLGMMPSGEPYTEERPCPCRCTYVKGKLVEVRASISD